MDSKRCPMCDTVKPFSEFYKKFGRENYKSKLDYKCKSCHNKYVESRRNRSKKNRTNVEWRKRNIDKYRAQQAVIVAVRHGELVKPDSCESCSAKKRLHGHHDDYRKPLSVRWLC